MPKPNIIVIHSHDLGDYLGCYGSPIPTPNIDQLAKEGAVLENHFSTGTICCPSRGSLWTGFYPHTHGLMGLVPRGWELDVDKSPHFADVINGYGYQSALFGLQHEHWDSYRLGFEEVYGDSPYYCDEVAPYFIDWLNQEKFHQPFFASIGFFDPHRIGSASQGYSPSQTGMAPSHFNRPVYKRHNPQDVEVRPYLLDLAIQREDLASFYGAVNLVDKMVGEIIEVLKAKGLYDDSIVIFTTDHGASFMHSKATLYDGGTKVAFVVRYPEKIRQETRVKALTSHVDFVPTVFEWLGIELPREVEGRSFAREVNGDDAYKRDYVFAENNYTQYFDPSRMIRSGRYKYIKHGLRRCIYDFVLTEIEMSSASFRQNKEVHQFYSSKRVFEEFYDLEKDPGEMHNLIGSSEYGSIINAHKEALDTHLQRTNDPFRLFNNEILMPQDVYSSVIKTKFE